MLGVTPPMVKYCTLSAKEGLKVLSAEAERVSREIAQGNFSIKAPISRNTSSSFDRNT